MQNMTIFTSTIAFALLSLTGCAHRRLHHRLIDSAQTGDKKAVLALLADGSDANAMPTGFPALFHAAQQGHKDTVKVLIGHGADVTINKWGWTALHSAAQKGHTDIAQLLIRHGASVSAEATLPVHDPAIDSCKGYTPLMGAALFARSDVASILLSSGADVNARSCLGTALHYAVRGGYIIPEGVPSTLMYNLPTDAMWFSFGQGHAEETITLLLESGANINATNEFGETPLMIASQHGTPRIVHMLLKHGAEVNLESEFGWTELTYAASRNQMWRNEDEKPRKLYLAIGMEMSGIYMKHFLDAFSSSDYQKIYSENNRDKIAGLLREAGAKELGVGAAGITIEKPSPPEEITSGTAFLRAEDSIRLLEINAESPPLFSRQPHRVELPVGKNILKVGYTERSRYRISDQHKHAFTAPFTDVAIEFTAKPGRYYQLQARERGLYWAPVILDMEFEQ